MSCRRVTYDSSTQITVAQSTRHTRLRTVQPQPRPAPPSQHPTYQYHVLCCADMSEAAWLFAGDVQRGRRGWLRSLPPCHTWKLAELRSLTLALSHCTVGPLLTEPCRAVPCRGGVYLYVPGDVSAQEFSSWLLNDTEGMNRALLCAARSRSLLPWHCTALHTQRTAHITLPATLSAGTVTKGCLEALDCVFVAPLYGSGTDTGTCLPAGHSNGIKMNALRKRVNQVEAEDAQAWGARVDSAMSLSGDEKKRAALVAMMLEVMRPDAIEQDQRWGKAKENFQAVAGRAAGGIGWGILFARYDDDGSGEMDVGEFTKAVRQDCGIAEAVVNDAELEEMFKAVDIDGSGGWGSSGSLTVMAIDSTAPH